MKPLHIFIFFIVFFDFGEAQICESDLRIAVMLDEHFETQK